MPRRVCDYPVAYEWYNWICTAGSIMSLLSVVIFIWVFVDAFYCNNFNFKRADDYAEAGWNLDTIHTDLFYEHYCRRPGAKLKAALLHDTSALFFVVHCAYLLALNNFSVSAARADENEEPFRMRGSDGR